MSLQVDHDAVPAGPTVGIGRFLRGQLPLLLLFATAPAVFRIIGLIRVGIPKFTVADAPEPLDYAVGIVSGFLQDLSVGAVLVLLVLLVRRRSGARPAAVAAAVMFVATHLYYLLDFLLYQRRLIRMSATFTEFFKFPKPFIDSAWEAGLGSLIIGCVALFGVGWTIWRSLRSGTVQSQPNTSAVAVTVIAIGAVGVESLFVPRTTYYATSNIVFRDVLSIIYDHEDIPRADDLDIAAAVPRPAEVFEPIDPAYPLLRRTTGFMGPTRFDVKTVGERPHVVVLFMESFRARDIGVLGAPHQPSASPNFDSLAARGVIFDNFYSSGVQTTRAVVASLFGVLPRFSRRAVQSDDVTFPLRGLPHLFLDHGYRTAFFHNGSLTFERKDDFFPAHGYQEVYGQHDVARSHPEAPRTSWGVHDEYFVEDLVDWLTEAERSGHTGFVTAFTVSNHHPWTPPDGFQTPDFGIDPYDEYHDFLRTFYYSDAALGRFAELIEDRDLSQRVVLFVLSDTGEPMGEHDGNYMAQRHLYEENVRIPLLIWAPGRIDGPVRIGDVGSQVDLLPTMMDVLGMHGVNHSMGISLRRVVPDRIAFFNNPFHLRLWGARKGPYKYIRSAAADESALYNLETDPSEEMDISELRPAIARDMETRVRTMIQVTDILYSERMFVPPEMLGKDSLD